MDDVFQSAVQLKQAQTAEERRVFSGLPRYLQNTLFHCASAQEPPSSAQPPRPPTKKADNNHEEIMRLRVSRKTQQTICDLLQSIKDVGHYQCGKDDEHDVEAVRCEVQKALCFSQQQRQVGNAHMRAAAEKGHGVTRGPDGSVMPPHLGTPLQLAAKAYEEAYSVFSYVSPKTPKWKENGLRDVDVAIERWLPSWDAIRAAPKRRSQHDKESAAADDDGASGEGSTPMGSLWVLLDDVRVHMATLMCNMALCFRDQGDVSGAALDALREVLTGQSASSSSAEFGIVSPSESSSMAVACNPIAPHHVRALYLFGKLTRDAPTTTMITMERAVGLLRGAMYHMPPTGATNDPALRDGLLEGTAQQVADAVALLAEMESEVREQRAKDRKQFRHLFPSTEAAGGVTPAGNTTTTSSTSVKSTGDTTSSSSSSGAVSAQEMMPKDRRNANTAGKKVLEGGWYEQAEQARLVIRQLQADPTKAREAAVMEQQLHRAACEKLYIEGVRPLRQQMKLRKNTTSSKDAEDDGKVECDDVDLLHLPQNITDQMGAALQLDCSDQKTLSVLQRLLRADQKAEKDVAAMDILSVERELLSASASPQISDSVGGSSEQQHQRIRPLFSRPEVAEFLEKRRNTASAGGVAPAEQREELSLAWAVGDVRLANPLSLLLALIKVVAWVCYSIYYAVSKLMLGSTSRAGGGASLSKEEAELDAVVAAKEKQFRELLVHRRQHAIHAERYKAE